MQKKSIKRFGLIIKAKPSKIKIYEKLHADNQKGVRKYVKKYESVQL